MTALFAQFVPWIVGGVFALLALVGVFFRGKSTGKQEARQDVAAKVNEQATQAAKESRDVQTTVDRLPDGAAATELRDKWMRKPPAGRP